MTVKQLIAELKKMPQGLTVYTASHDHSPWEVDSYVVSVEHIVKADEMELDPFCAEEREMESQPDEWVTIRG